MSGQTVEDVGFQELVAIRIRFGDAARTQKVTLSEVELRDGIANSTQ
jgi:hypothetical protein